jgi:hypothetical protein
MNRLSGSRRTLSVTALALRPLGLTPGNRVRLGVAVAAPPDELAVLLARRDSRDD